MEFAQGEEPRRLPGGGIDAYWGNAFSLYRGHYATQSFQIGKSKGQSQMGLAIFPHSWLYPLQVRSTV